MLSVYQETLEDYIDELITSELSYDIGSGDLTTFLTVDEGCDIDFSLVTRVDAVVCGVEIAQRVFETLSADIEWTSVYVDGAHVEKGTPLLTGHGSAQAVLAAERTALNIMQHVMGIATQTAAYVNAVAGTGAVILDTRKTLPGLRELQKYAVRVGGGQNHRFSLDRGILIKDNHIAAAGSVKQAVMAARTHSPVLTGVEVECDTLEQVKEALEAQPDIIMLDNMSPAKLKEAVTLVNGRVKLEASGGITLENVRSVAETGVDYISIGALTHSVTAVDIGLDIAYTSDA